MRSIPGSVSQAQRGFLDILRTWLGSGPGEAEPSTAKLASETEWLPAHGDGSTRVLVVDDNPVNLMLVSAMLELRGLVPCLAQDGAEALAIARERHFDLILMDLQMPILGGLAATSAIRRFERDCSRPPVPVVAYTSMSPRPEVLAAHGLSGSLRKPCEDEDLEACLVRWCPTYVAATTLAVDALAGSRSQGGNGHLHARF